MSFIEQLRRWFGVLRRDEHADARGVDTGAWGEELAERHLKGKGYTVLGRRVRIRRDELDLVTRAPGGEVVFVEVKTRSSEAFGRPFSSIDKRKRRALSRAAWGYLKRMRPKPSYFRFDVVEVVGNPERRDPVIRHIENGFSLMGRKRWPW